MAHLLRKMFSAILRSLLSLRYYKLYFFSYFTNYSFILRACRFLFSLLERRITNHWLCLPDRVNTFFGAPRYRYLTAIRFSPSESVPKNKTSILKIFLFNRARNIISPVFSIVLLNEVTFLRFLSESLIRSL